MKPEPQPQPATVSAVAVLQRIAQSGPLGEALVRAATAEAQLAASTAEAGPAPTKRWRRPGSRYP